MSKNIFTAKSQGERKDAVDLFNKIGYPNTRLIKSVLGFEKSEFQAIKKGAKCAPFSIRLFCPIHF